ncbi:hypothetical protein [Fictibacillus barbaricus]|uniref:MFS transporter n=1 Tax=Fictibacillus barbaricus TaxID=182136 RepID=A0ABU1U0Z6_9BACL|nr:hypothetical protein [Fictibacillus barbaricus]MDR7073144.1 hypothetical protein [Fictibacillus barbaricus]
MTQIIILLLFTLVVSPLLYFFPSNIPLKYKMALLGIAFALAIGGLFILNVLSYWMSVSAMIAVAFIASYLAEKRMPIMDTNSEKTEIVLSFTDEETTAAPSKVEQEQSPIELESVIVIEDNTEYESDDGDEIDFQQEESNLLEEIEFVSEVIEPVEEIEVIEQKPEEIIEEIQVEVNEKIIPFVEVTDDEFAFLLEGREIIEEELQGTPVHTDEEDEEVLLQRSMLMDELEELDAKLPQEMMPDQLENIIVAEEIVELVDLMEEEERTSEIEVHTEEEEVEQLSISDAVTFVEEMNEVDVDSIEPDEIFLEERQVIDSIDDHLEEISLQDLENNVEKEAVETTEEVSEIPVLEVIEDLEEDAVEPEIIQDEKDSMSDEEQQPKELTFVQQNMDAAMQDMLLNTLTYYQEQGDQVSYTSMLESLINQPLSDKDFYLFTKLLADSYISNQNSFELKALLDSMKDRLNSYPVISEEIEQYLAVSV